MSALKELQFQVVVDDQLADEVAEGVVAYGDFKPSESSLIYDSADAFYADLILGRPMPLTFVTKSINTVGALVVVSLFLHRDLALHPATSSLVMAARLADSFGFSGLAHVDRDLAQLIQVALKYMMGASTASSPNHKKEQQERLTTCVSWVKEYVLNGRLPGLPREADPPRVIDRGTNGFVVAVVGEPFCQSWLELYRMGFLRGVVFGDPQNDRRQVLAARKSPYIAFDLAKAGSLLNDVEASMGEPRGWVNTGDWLYGPRDGTLLPVSSIVSVLTRV